MIVKIGNGKTESAIHEAIFCNILQIYSRGYFMQYIANISSCIADPAFVVTYICYMLDLFTNDTHNHAIHRTIYAHMSMLIYLASHIL